MNTTNRAAELFHKLQTVNASVSAIRKADLKFLKGRYVRDAFHDLKVSDVEATFLEIHRENLPLDGAVSLELGLALVLKDGKSVFDESVTVSVYTDGVSVEVLVSDLEGAGSLEITLDDLEPVLARLV